MTPITFSHSLSSTRAYLLGHFVLALCSESFTDECCGVGFCVLMAGVFSWLSGQSGIPWFSYLSDKYPWLATFWSPTWEPVDWVHGVNLIAQSGTNVIKSCKFELGTLWEVDREQELSLTEEPTSPADSSWRAAHDCTQWNKFHYKPCDQHFWKLSEMGQVHRDNFVTTKTHPWRLTLFMPSEHFCPLKSRSCYDIIVQVHSSVYCVWPKHLIT